MKCPRDQTEFKVVSEEQNILGCPHCKGIYVGSEEVQKRVERILEVRGSGSGLVHGALLSPHTGRPMKEIEVKGVTIDLCRSSGYVWFDKGEYEKIQIETPNQNSNGGKLPEWDVWDKIDAATAVFEIGGLVVESACWLLEKCTENISLDLP